MLQVPDDATQDVINRLARAEGQLRGLQRMLTEKRDCKEIMSQLTAARHALEQAGFQLAAAGLAYCIQNPEDAQRSGYTLDEARKLFHALA